jgi:acyl carrier protein
MAERQWGAASAGVREKILALIVEIFDVTPDEVCGAENLMIDLGGSSLDYFTLVGELDRAFDIRLPYESEGFGYSLDDLERLVKELLKAKCDSSTNSSDGSP